MELTFTRKRPGIYVAPVSEDAEILLLNASGGNGYSLSLRDRRTRHILARGGVAGHTLKQAKEAADRVASDARFGAVLLAVALL